MDSQLTTGSHSTAILDEGPLPPGWTLTGLPQSMTLAFRQRAVRRIATRFIPMLRHRRNLRLKRQQAQSKIKMSHKDISNALRATGSPLFSLAGDANAETIIDMCIEEGTLSSHSNLGEIVIYAGEPCAPCAWFLVRGRLEQFQGAISWHSPNLSTKSHTVFPSFEHMCRKSYVYRHTGGGGNTNSSSHHHHDQHHHHSAAGGGLHASHHLNKSSMSTTSSNNDNNSDGQLSRKSSFAGTTTQHHGNNKRDMTVTSSSSSSHHQQQSGNASSSPSVSTETVYTCTAKGGLSRYIHGRRGGTEVRAPKTLCDLASIASYHFTSFYTVPLSSFDPSAPKQQQQQQQQHSGSNKEDSSSSSSILILRVPRTTINKIYTRYMTADQREKLLIYKLPEFREHEMINTLPLHPLQIHESWLFRGIDDTTLRMLTKAAIPFALTQGHPIAQKGKRLAHILFIQRGLVALRDDKQEIKTILGPGSVYGEREALFRERLTVSVFALTNVDVLALSLKTVQHQLASSDAAKTILNRNAAQRRQRDLHASFESSGGRLAESVRRTPLLPVPELAETLIPYLKPRVFSAGEHIVDSTSECDRIVYLTRGCAVVRGLRDENGGEVLFQRGECVGFTCLVSHRWERTIVAAEPVDTWELSRADFYKWLKRHSYSPSEEDLFYNKKFAQAVKKVLPHTVIPGASKESPDRRRQSTSAAGAGGGVHETKLIEASKQVISTMTDSARPDTANTKNKKKNSPTRNHGSSQQQTTTTTTTTQQSSSSSPSSKINNTNNTASTTYTGPSHILRENGLVICQGEIDPKTHQPMRKFPHLYSLVVGRILQLLQPFHVQSVYPRDSRLDRYTMNPILHYGEDLAVKRKRTGGASHGFISLKSGGGAGGTSMMMMQHQNVFGGEDSDVNQQQQTTTVMNPLLDSSFADANLDDTAVFNNNNNNNNDQQLEANNDQQQQEQQPNNENNDVNVTANTTTMDASLIQSANNFYQDDIENGLDEYEILIAQHLRHQRHHHGATASTSIRGATHNMSIVSSSDMMMIPPTTTTQNNNHNNDAAASVRFVAPPDHNTNQDQVLFLENNLMTDLLPPQRNTLPWLETPNLHPTSFEVNDIVYRPWMPPIRPSMTISSHKYFHASSASSPSRDTHHNNSPTHDGERRREGDEQEQGDDGYDFYDDEDVAEKKAAGRGMLINLAKIRGPRVNSSDDDDSQNDNDDDNIDDVLLQGGTSSSSPSGHHHHHHESRKKQKRNKRRRNMIKDSSAAALDLNDAASSATTRPPMSTFTPTLTNHGDHNVDMFGTLLSHSYSFTPATQFEQAARHRSELEKRLLLVDKSGTKTTTSIMSSANQDNQESSSNKRSALLLQQLNNNSISTMPTSQEALASFYETLDHDFDTTGEFEASPFRVEHCVVESDFADILYPNKAVARKRWKSVRTSVGVKDEEEQARNLAETAKGLSDSEIRKMKAGENLAQMSQAIRDAFFGRSVYHRHSVEAKRESLNNNNNTAGTSSNQNNNNNSTGRGSPGSRNRRGSASVNYYDGEDDLLSNAGTENGSVSSTRNHNNNNKNFDNSVIGRISSRPPLSKAVIEKCMKDHKQRISGPRHQIIKLAKQPKNAVLRALTPQAQQNHHHHHHHQNNNIMNNVRRSSQQQNALLTSNYSSTTTGQDTLEPPSPLDSQQSTQRQLSNNTHNQGSGEWSSSTGREDSGLLSQQQYSASISSFDSLQRNTKVPVPPMLRHRGEQHDDDGDEQMQQHPSSNRATTFVDTQRKFNYDNTTKQSFISDHLTERPTWKPRPPVHSDYLEKHQERRPASARLYKHQQQQPTVNGTSSSSHAHAPPSLSSTSVKTSRFSRTIDFSSRRKQNEYKNNTKRRAMNEAFGLNDNHQNNTRRLSNVTELDNEWRKRNFSCLSSHSTSASEMVGSLLLNWKQATENSKNRKEHEEKKAKKSILLQPRRQYQPEIDNPEYFYNNYQDQRQRHHHSMKENNAIPRGVNDDDEEDIDETEMFIN